MTRAVPPGLSLVWGPLDPGISPEALASALPPGLEDLEAILLVEGNEARLREMGRAGRERLDRVEVLALAPGAASGQAWNLGLSRARGRSVLFLEGRCLPERGFVERAGELLAQGGWAAAGLGLRSLDMEAPQAVLAQMGDELPWLIPAKGDAGEGENAEPHPPGPGLWPEAPPFGLTGGLGPGPAVYLRREILAAGGFQPGHRGGPGEDLALLAGLAEREQKLAALPRPQAPCRRPADWPGLWREECRRGWTLFAASLALGRRGVRAGGGALRPRLQAGLVLAALILWGGFLFQSPLDGLIPGSVCLLLLYPLNRPFLKAVLNNHPGLLPQALIYCLVRAPAWLWGMMTGGLARLTSRT